MQHESQLIAATLLPMYFPSKGNFDEAKKQVTESMQQKFGQNFHKFTEFIPQFDINRGVLEQGQEFNEGFNIFGQHLK